MLLRWKPIVLFVLLTAFAVTLLDVHLNASEAEAQVSVQSTSVTLTPIKDNTIYEDENGSLSNGSGQLIISGTEEDGSIRRALIAFDFSSIPAGSTIDAVTIDLYAENVVSGFVQSSVLMHKLSKDWGEGVSNAASDTES
jgi:hypothetical protein